MLPHSELKSLLHFARTLVEEAGKRTLNYFQQQVKVEIKADQSPVTIADREAEEWLRNQIMKQFPDHQIMGEEFGLSDNNSAFKWIIDPIDGTKSFISGVPLYSNLLALEVDGVVEIGIANFPALNEMVYASTQQGAYVNDMKIKVGTETNLSAATAMITDLRDAPASLIPHLNQFRFYRTWGDAYGHYMVAAGRADVMFDPKMNPWDCAPFSVIFKEAGGFFGDWNGIETIYGDNAFSCNDQLKPVILKILSSLSG